MPGTLSEPYTERNVFCASLAPRAGSAASRGSRQLRVEKQVSERVMAERTRIGGVETAIERGTRRKMAMVLDLIELVKFVGGLAGRA
jgi:hypothetical protein